MKEYIYKDDELDQDCDETFIGVIRKGEELIRCRDCKYWDYDTCFVEKADGYDRPIYNRFDNDYCSMAERKEK